MPATKHRVSLIGPPTAGKTGLLVTMEPCLNIKRVHGYPAHHTFQVNGHDDKNTTLTNIWSPGRLNDETTKYFNQFAGYEGTTLDQSKAYQFEITRNIAANGGAANGPETRDRV